MVILTAELQARLRAEGVETFHAPGFTNLPDDVVFEPPCAIKWIGLRDHVRMGAFSYAVSGYFARVRIGRYCSIGEQVQVGRANHPMTLASTSPFFYHRNEPLFNVGHRFNEAEAYHNYKAPKRAFNADAPDEVIIENDVWIGHGAFIRPGVRVGNGAIIGAMSVVRKDVPPFAVVAGNPALVRRMRLPSPIAAQLQELAWWRFAPWQLTAVDFSVPETAIDQLRDIIPTLQPYAPQPVIPKSLASAD